MKKIVLVIFLFGFIQISSQTNTYEERKGKVSFLTSQNIYVRFESTNGINKNDTLFYIQNKKLIPAIVVQYISSSSCSGISITGYQFKNEDEIVARIKLIREEKSEQNLTITKKNDEVVEALISKKEAKNEGAFFKRSNGNFSVSSYSNKSNGPGSADLQHWRFNFSFDADSISNSPISISSYINFSYRTDRWQEVKKNIGQALKVYDFAIHYDLTPDTKVTFGRKINFKTSSLGAIDGIQLETSLNKFVLGAVVGSHPSFNDYGYDVKMFEYGGYLFRSDSIGTITMQNTLGIFEQTNNFKTDRRFLYLQHINSITQSLGFFVSSEVDLYKRKNGIDQNVLNLTSLFAMGTFNPADWVGFSASYDARKNIVYYETYKTYADSILESVTRQGLSLRVNVRPINYLWIGINYGYRFSADDPRPSNNFGVNINYLQIPLIVSGLNMNYNRIESGYVNGNYYGASLYKDLFNGELNISLGYKLVDYQFATGQYSFIQRIGNFDLTWRMFSSVFFTASYEGTFQDKTTYGRLYISLSKRF
jgi:hypothetical protein